jgi:putative ABC transport system substrate-binding protein
MKRREFIAGLGGVAALPFIAQAQQRQPVIGLLGVGAARNSERVVAPVRRGLQEASLIEGRDFVIEQRWAEGQYQRIPEFAEEFVRRDVAIIVAAGGTQSALVARSKTKTIPIVFNAAADPVAAGLVSSLERPDGNLTGVSNLAGELGPKRLELLREVLPRTGKNIALLANPSNRAVTPAAIAAIEVASKAASINVQVIHATSESEFEAAFSQARLMAAGMVIVPDLVFLDNIERFGELSVRHTVPAIFQFREFAAAGGLMSYGGSFADAMHQVGVYAGRLLRGSKPVVLPVQQFTKIELVINLKTAKRLGLKVPLPLLGRADEVIE